MPLIWQYRRDYSVLKGTLSLSEQQEKELKTKVTSKANRFKRILPTLALVALSSILVLVARGMLSDGTAANYIIAIEGDPPKFSLHNGHDHPLEVATFTVVYRNFKANRHEELWTLVPKAPDIKALAINNITYGEVPPGWAEKAPAKPIDMNKPNQLIVTTKNNRFFIDIQARDDWKTSGTVSRN